MNRTKIKELITGLAKHDLCPVIIDITGLSDDDVNLETNAQPMFDGVMIYLESSTTNVLFAKKIMEDTYTLHDVVLSSLVRQNDGYGEYSYAQFTIKAKHLKISKKHKNTSLLQRVQKKLRKSKKKLVILAKCYPIKISG